jgi:hypothetical protein
VRLPFIRQEEYRRAQRRRLISSSRRAQLDALLASAFMLQAMASANHSLALRENANGFLLDPAVTRATIEHLRDRFARHIGSGDSDLEALGAEAQTIIEYGADIEARRDPLRGHAGIRRFAYRSPLDGELSPFGMYLPKAYVDSGAGGTKTYPLVVVLHGMNSKPISMRRWFFGHDEEGRDSEWEDRHPGEVESIDGFVLSPNAYGNAMYRELGELDVVKLLDWATGVFPIDPNRITITGASMGGTGAASIAFRYLVPIDSLPPSRSAVTTAISFART